MAIPSHAPINHAEQLPLPAGKSSTADAEGGLKIGSNAPDLTGAWGRPALNKRLVYPQTLLATTSCTYK
ncbi:hypothetical protein GN277_07995 [Lachnospiraceae bacterium WCA-9-b2]|uniref:Uncharacterized protein n=1 Tax=Sporofaciens musculi TaxID=2681861 RepID=A0A7X3SIE2_9FIRM|nr:hypothetical protein [Sporofaciens musculi]MXP75325.1 hypothetical protein [Sporofaciens musculi]